MKLLIDRNYKNAHTKTIIVILHVRIIIILKMVYT